jgi:hypothetical protein
MRQLRIFGLALVSVFVVAVMTAAAASAESMPLPLIHTALPGETYPLDLAGEVKSDGITLANSLTSLPATLVSILLLVKELTALGPASIDFSGVREFGSATKCNTVGDDEGIVLVPGAEFHFAYTSLSPGKVLETAKLILFSKFVIVCGVDEPVEVVVTGPLLSRFSEVPGNSANGGDSTEVQTVTHCSNATNGIQEISSYFTDSTIEVTKQLLLAVVSGMEPVNACLEIPGTLLLTVGAGSLATMFTVLL